jgi:hypothetical protein
MHTIGINGQSNPYPVVDDQGDVVSSQKGLHFFGQRHQVPGGHVFFSELDQAHPALNRLFQNLENIPASTVALTDNQVQGVVD